ncbi:DUF2336 domain-containing protein [Roseospirillum parvum]|uniref:Uncharacterized conserved protein, DUF2336 family n=1 Tax=Roseospirillum parvum TaxID=83401 RepID=A0A1G7WXC6_9PROT|nr:DUF2336 domain-containing protein [Roseospirillum parvum]SDG76597.1 Uncharacterized conserved protein, DUF2336 family [Roseospirillum parvum]
MADKKLSVEDVNRLLADPSPDTRAETAGKLARQFDDEELSPGERELAEDIFRLMVRDAEVRVRQALAVNLKENPLLPHDLARTLADDVDSVSLPILEFSTVLTSEDLVEIVRSQGAAKQMAVARRASVAPEVSDALVDHGDEDVVATLVGNAGAEITESAMLKAVDKYGDSDKVQSPLAHRSGLPVTVAERLVTRVSEHLKTYIIRHHELPADVAADLLMQSRERATITLSTESSEDEVETLVTQLRDNGRLTPSIVVRAVCMGDIKFFEYAMALLAGIPIVNARQLIHDQGNLGLRGILEKTGLPRSIFPAVRAAVEVAAETDYDGLEDDRARYSRRMIERVLTQYGDLGVEFESGDLEYLMAKMSALPPTLASGA